MWQSEAIAVIQLGLALTLWPTIRSKKSKVVRLTSVPASAGLWLLAGIYFTLGLWTAMAMSSICALAWTFIAVFRNAGVNNASPNS